MTIKNKIKPFCWLVISLVVGILIGYFFQHRFNARLDNNYTNNNQQATLEQHYDCTHKTADKTKINDAVYLKHFMQFLAENNYQASLVVYQDCEKYAPDILINLQEHIFDYLTHTSVSNAITFIELYLNSYPTDSELIIKLAEYYQINNEPYKAIELYLDADIRTAQWLNICSRKVYQLAKLLYNNTPLDYDLINLFQLLVCKYPSCSFYRFALAKLYLNNGHIEEAKSDLALLTENNKYGKKAQDILNSITEFSVGNSDSIDNSTAIPLSKYGDHFVIGATAANIKMQLLIDTGTTLTVISSDLLAKIQENQGLIKVGKISLLTANGEIETNLYRIKKFSLASYDFYNLEVAESVVEIEGIDGLLGMNALNGYNFFIDQSDSILSLSPK